MNLCKSCNKEIKELTRHKYRKQNYCSKECSIDSIRKPSVFFSCSFCGNSFERRSDVSRKIKKHGKGLNLYCSRQCYNKSRIGKVFKEQKLETIQCRFCNTTFESKPWNARYYCSSECNHLDKEKIETFVCLVCSCSFECSGKDRRTVKPRLKKYCSKECSGQKNQNKRKKENAG